MLGLVFALYDYLLCKRAELTRNNNEADNNLAQLLMHSGYILAVLSRYVNDATVALSTQA